MHDHVDASEIEDFVIGALAGDRRARFETHLSSCDHCAQRLAREARLEVALVEVQAAAAATRRRQRLVAGSMWGAPVLVVAILAALVLGKGDRPGGAGSARAHVVCSDGPDQLACVDDAHRHGLFVQYPVWAGPPPFGEQDPSAGPSAAPFQDGAR